MTKDYLYSRARQTERIKNETYLTLIHSLEWSRSPSPHGPCISLAAGNRPPRSGASYKKRNETSQQTAALKCKNLKQAHCLLSLVLYMPQVFLRAFGKEVFPTFYSLKKFANAG